MLPRLLIAATLLALISGCVQAPQNAEGYRQMAHSESMWVELEKFEVDRPYQEVAKTFKSRSDACLRIQIVTQAYGGYLTAPATFKEDYRPTVTMNAQRAEFHLQVERDGTNMINLHDPAEGGDFVLVADAYPLGPNRSRIELYQPSMGYEVLTDAVRNWATGKSTACPDLTQ